MATYDKLTGNGLALVVRGVADVVPRRPFYPKIEN